MKIRKFLFGTSAVLALVLSFAFKPAAFSKLASVKEPGGWGCADLLLTDDDCLSTNTGPQCTAYYGYTHTYEPAYEDVAGASPYDCTIPLYHFSPF